ncbi:hypothetical protein BOV94_12655 [Solemya velum gill symbiont]|uniref:hypothetical protein n=1 Tax=Solemya velum gill symbiont TaxID=2340 RepID=UPI0009986DA5|nr:hypothetical protein [Solemya velum gill symbiont]OOY49048.1 hypothetical protein BOV94_12655 [Solemya velum gill symbiont]
MTSQSIFPESEWKKIKSAGLPEMVVHYVENAQYSKERADLIRKMVSSSPDLIKMWQSFERRHSNTNYDSLWVIVVFGRFEEALELPAFYYKSSKERAELVSEINRTANRLAVLLKENDLDANLIYIPSGNFKGFFVYEDFSDSNQWWIDRDKTDRALISVILKNIAERSKREVKAVEVKANKTKNMPAILFARSLASRNYSSYGKVLNASVATATNALFDTKYDESGIKNLLKS